VRRMFLDAPGVLKFNKKPLRRSARGHVTLRIPATVLERKLRELAE
jgi:hypothetical protein